MGFVQIIERDEQFVEKFEDSSFTLRRLHPDVSREIRRRAMAQDANGKAPTEAESIQRENDDILDHIIIGWADVTDGKGMDVPCTREMKLALPNVVKMKLTNAIYKPNVMTADQLKAVEQERLAKKKQS